jgi:hypothetical protein
VFKNLAIGIFSAFICTSALADSVIGDIHYLKSTEEVHIYPCDMSDKGDCQIRTEHGVQTVGVIEAIHSAYNVGDVHIISMQINPFSTSTMHVMFSASSLSKEKIQADANVKQEMQMAIDRQRSRETQEMMKKQKNDQDAATKRANDLLNNVGG